MERERIERKNLSKSIKIVSMLIHPLLHTETHIHEQRAFVNWCVIVIAIITYVLVVVTIIVAV